MMKGMVSGSRLDYVDSEELERNNFLAGYLSHWSLNKNSDKQSKKSFRKVLNCIFPPTKEWAEESKNQIN